MSTRRLRPLVPIAVASVLLVPALLPSVGSTAAAQSADAQAERTFMRVTAPMVDVKSGPQDYYYGFFKLAEGDIVEVVDQKASSFTAILTKGPRFVAGYALLRVRDDESFSITGPERTTASGRTARTGVSDQRLQLLYPNIDETDLLNRSWRMIRRIDPGVAVQVFGSPITGDGVTLHRISLPTDALGFVAKAALAPATEAEAADFLAWEANPTAWLARRRAEAEAQAQAEQRRIADARAAAEAAAAATAAAEAATRIADAGPSDETPATEAATPVATPERTVEETADPAVITEDPATDPLRTQTEETTGTPETSDAEVAETADADADATGANAGDPAGAAGTDGPDAAGVNADAAEEPSGSVAVSTLPPAERLEALEQAFDLLRTEDLRRVEVMPLAGLYRAFATDMVTENPEKATYASTRARQLEVWARLQDQRDRIEALRNSMGETNVAIAEAASSIQSQLGFSAVGRLASSRIFDGTRLPRLLRLEALDSGRTLAYVRDIAELDLDSRVGEIVGLFGARTYDPGLQLDILDATRVRSVRLDIEEVVSPGVSEG